MPRVAEIPDAAADATAIEKADVVVAQAAAPYRDTPSVKAIGFLSEAADQPPLIALNGAILAAGLLIDDKRLARAGGRMLAAHLLATGIKDIVKRFVDRTRPSILVEEGRYDMSPGRSEEKELTSFPSGHTAGAVAVACAYSREYPEHALAAYVAAGAAALAQIPRCAHYPSDIGVGALIGLAADIVVDAVIRKLSRSEPSTFLAP